MLKRASANSVALHLPSTGLGAREVGVAFGDFRVLTEVTLDVNRGEIVGLIGPNGAGKTTLINVLSGYQSPTSGTVALEGADVTRWSAGRRARSGIVRTFQAGRLFGSLTCRENILAACFGVGTGRRDADKLANQLLDDIDLASVADVAADNLSYGQARLLSIARALAARPNYLLLDEPAAGLNEAEVPQFSEMLRALPGKYECGVLVIEHDMSVVMAVCARLVVLDHGVVIGEGTPEDVRRDPEVRRAYLGTEVSTGA